MEPLVTALQRSKQSMLPWRMLRGAVNATGAPKLYRLQGDLRQALGEDEVESCYQTALEIARRQQAKILELRAAVSLGKLWQGHGRKNEAHRLVAEACGWFSEGFETPDLCIARDFLAQYRTLT